VTDFDLKPALLIESLRQPSAYPHPVRDLRVVETHISWLILTGDFAYKIKKPVWLGFVDFSTLERRRFFCQEELRLNRRLAPELYLDVVPITGVPAAPAVGGAGEPFEFAVKLRQFSDSEELGASIQRQPLSPAEIDGLALQIADFHRQIPLAAIDSQFGDHERISGIVADNLAGLATDPEIAALVQSLRRWTRREFWRRSGDFWMRKQRGFVRECHGDMHLGNMLRRDGRIVIFDCLEFNPELRWIDLISEVAFTAMDLEFRGFRPAAWRLLNAYLSATGDYFGLNVLRWYLVYRALVRAKVAHITAEQLPTRKRQARAVALDRCRSYLKLAERFTKPRRPVLVITHGLSGSGKTMLTDSLLGASGAVRIRSDVERKRLANMEPLDRSTTEDAELYSSAATERTYRWLAKIAELALRAAWPVIVDATFLLRSQRDAFRRLADEVGAPFLVLDLQTSDEKHRARLRERRRDGKDASDADLEVYQQQLRWQEPLGAEEQSHALTLSSDDPGALDLAIQALERARSGASLH
jgi:aminoglycoside phosphotransferase family enzyme/predicted kinase